MLASRRLTGSRKDLQRLEDGEGGMFLAFPPAHLAPGSLHRPQAWSYALQGLLCPRGYWGCEREWEGEGRKPNWGALRGQKCLLLPCPLSPKESPKALGLALHPWGPL